MPHGMDQMGKQYILHLNMYIPYERHLFIINLKIFLNDRCVAITSTEHFKVNETTNIHVGNCDYGPLSFLLLKNTPPPSGPAIKDYYVY